MQAQSEHAGRWDGVKRVFTKQDVERLRGSIKVEHTLARLGSERFWKLVNSEPYVHALGALTGAKCLLVCLQHPQAVSPFTVHKPLPADCNRHASLIFMVAGNQAVQMVAGGKVLICAGCSSVKRASSSQQPLVASLDQTFTEAQRKQTFVLIRCFNQCVSKS